MSLSTDGSVSRLVPLPIPAAHWGLVAPLFFHSVAYVAHADGMNVECIAEYKTDLESHPASLSCAEDGWVSAKVLRQGNIPYIPT